jgi:hypothetical protein
MIFEVIQVSLNTYSVIENGEAELKTREQLMEYLMTVYRDLGEMLESTHG